MGLVTEDNFVYIQDDLIVSTFPDSPYKGKSFMGGGSSPQLEAARIAAAIVQATDLLVNSGRWNPPDQWLNPPDQGLAPQD